MYIIVDTATEQYNFQLLIHSMIDRRVNDGIRKFVAHVLHAKLMVYMDCTAGYSYACMHGGDSDLKSINDGCTHTFVVELTTVSVIKTERSHRRWR
jgi:hypothetical protein